jgi:hypothetical protein
MTVPYIINVALILAACLSFYKVLLRRETFYRVNRFMLLGCLVVAFVLPMITVPEKFSLRTNSSESRVQSSETGTEQLKSRANILDEKQGAPIVDLKTPYVEVKVSETGTVQTSVPAKYTYTADQLLTGNLQNVYTESSNQKSAIELTAASPNVKLETINNKQSTITSNKVLNWLMFLYWFGVIIFGASFLFQLIVLLYRSFKYPVIIDGRYRIVEMSGDHAPCSFGNTIFINPSKYDWDTFNQILLHEKIHIRQKHTLDIILAELVLVFQWFNPFAWVYRREIENNLEYLTDDQLVQEPTVDKKSYQLSLLKVSAPHLPLSLTTNYNQSTLKKRIAMMNTKRSSLHTAWKYLFLLPVLVLLVCLLNEPGIVNAQNQKDSSYKVKDDKAPGPGYKVQDDKAPGPGYKVQDDKIHAGIDNKGYWFAVIKDDKVNIRFSDEKIDSDEFEMHKGRNFNGNSFTLAELGTLPRGTEGKFAINREAGKLEMTGKFEGNQGMGTYEFFPDNSYFDHMDKELKGGAIDEDEKLAFFFLDIRKSYVSMLKNQGFKDLDKDEVIPATALGIDAAFVKMIRENGFKDASLEELIPIKALGIDAAYIKEIKESGIKDVDLDDLVSYKAQGIDKEYIQKMKAMKGKDGKELDKDEVDDLVSFKAMGIDEAYIKSWKDAGIDVPHDQLVAFKAMGITPEYIKSWKDAGYKDIDIDEYVGLKSQNVTPEFLKSFTDLGYKNIKPEDMVAFRALGVTPEYIKGFQAMGYKETDLDEYTGLKSQGVTPEMVKSYEALGFKNIDLEEMVAVKAMGVTPEYIKEMRAKGLNYDRLEKYVRLKSID